VTYSYMMIFFAKVSV